MMIRYDMIIGRIIPLFLGFIMLKSLLTRSLLIACCTFTLGYSTQSYAVDDEFGLELSEEEMVDTPIESIQKFVEVYHLVKQNYVHSVSDEQLFTNAMQGLLKGLDPYSRYLTAQEYQDLVKYTEGELGTVDFELVYVPSLQQWVIENLKADADSAKLGLKNGMVISKIADKSLAGLNHDQVHDALTGQMGSKISIQLGLQNKPIQLILNQKKNVDVRAKLFAEQRVLWIQIPVFTQDTAHEIKRIYDDYAQQNIQGIILDLRNNPGGLLSSAVETADLFLEQGLIVSTKSRAEGSQNFRAIAGHSIQQPVAILINHKTASAAEVVTSALQQQHRAWVVGEKSYGKGVVQKVLALGNGDAVSLTVADYYTPDGHKLEGKGIEPNLLYPLAVDVNEQDYLERIAGFLLNHIATREYKK